MIEALEFTFIQNALYTAILVGIAVGIIGSLIAVNKMIFLAGGIAHAAYGGIGIAIFFGAPIFLGASLFSVVVALIMAFLIRKRGDRIDTIIGVIWAVGMAIGIIFIDMTPGYTPNIMSYLFGSILSVATEDLWFMVALDIVIIATIILFYHNFLAISYDAEFAQVRGIGVQFFYALMLVLAALTVVVSIRAVGLILVIALLSIPTYIAEQYARSLFQMMFIATLLATAFTTLGLILAFSLNLTSGAAIIAVSAIAFGANILTKSSSR